MAFVPHHPRLACDEWLDTDAFDEANEEETSWKSKLIRTALLVTLPVVLPAYALFLVWAVISMENDGVNLDHDFEKEREMGQQREEGREMEVKAQSGKEDDEAWEVVSVHEFDG